MGNNNDGFSMTHLPLFQALTEHVLLAGVPKSVLALLVCVTFLFIAFFGFFYIALLTVPLYLMCIYMAEGDAQFFDCYTTYITKEDYYST